MCVCVELFEKHPLVNILVECVLHYLGFTQPARSYFAL